MATYAGQIGSWNAQPIQKQNHICIYLYIHHLFSFPNHLCWRYLVLPPLSLSWLIFCLDCARAVAILHDYANQSQINSNRTAGQIPPTTRCYANVRQINENATDQTQVPLTVFLSTHTPSHVDGPSCRHLDSRRSSEESPRTARFRLTHRACC